MPKRLDLEPIPRDFLPKDLRGLPSAVAMEMYGYRAVRRGPARIFYREFENSLRAKSGRKEVAFRVHDLVFFFAKAAADGIIGNLAYNLVKGAVNKIRRPRKELLGATLQFDAVVSRRTYSRVRREKHPGVKASRKQVSKLEKRLETQYRLIVKLTRNSR